MIVIDHLTKTFPEPASIRSRVFHPFARAPRRTVIDDVSLSVGRGELVGLLGGNGAGKTTLMQILSTLSRGDAGVVTIGGVHLDREPARIRREIGFCGAADRGFYYRLSVRENLAFFCALGQRVAARDRDRRIAAVLELVDLQSSAERLYAHLSTGMRQRLGVARALLGDPPVLLFDEPTRAVDPIHAAELRRLIRKTLVDELGKTVVLATNLLEEAWAICHRVAILRGGRVVAFAAPAALQHARHGNARLRVVARNVGDDVLASIRQTPGCVALTAQRAADSLQIDVEIERVPFALSAFLQALTSSGADVVSVDAQDAALADVFAELAGEA
jgi:ABC-2 type transport system ATP-binding protein